MEEWSEFLLGPRDFSLVSHQYLCEIIHIKGRWILIIANIKRRTAVIVDFKYDDSLPLQAILRVVTLITLKTYNLDISSFSIEGVLFTASEKTDSGYYIVNYLWKFLMGAMFDKVKFSKVEKINI